MMQSDSNHTNRSSIRQLAAANAGTDLDRRNYKRLIWRLVVWAVAVLLAKYLIEIQGIASAVAIGGLIIVCNLLALYAVVGYVRFFRYSDGPLREILQSGHSGGFAAGISLVVFYQLLPDIGLPAIAAFYVASALLVGWAIGIVAGLVSYRDWLD